MREKNLEQMVKSGEEKSELYLEKHIREQLRGRQKSIKAKLSDDVLVDWMMIGAFVAVSGLGFLMWRKLKE